VSWDTKAEISDVYHAHQTQVAGGIAVWKDGYAPMEMPIKRLGVG